MRVISFDLDGTLISSDFVNCVWLEKIPLLYAEQNGMSIEKAKSFIYSEYEKIGDGRLEWYNIGYWLKFFDIDAEYMEIFKMCRNKLHLYEDAKKILNDLDEDAIIISNAAREFIEYEIMELGIEGKFSYIFSAVSDFDRVKKDGEVYTMICNKIGVDSQDMYHVGDNFEFDYVAAKKAGINAYYLDRSGNVEGEHVVHSLIDFYEEVKKYEKSNKVYG